jgi:nucleoside-diphosphate-sugar epimerase
MARTDGPLALVIGATGGIGGAVADRLLASGWRVRALNRDPRTAAARAARAVEWVAGDAMNPADVLRAAAGAELIVHGANPPGYRNWAGLALPMLESTIQAATAHRARILFPGTIYNFGPDAFPRIAEESPQQPRTRKGKIRVAMEEALMRAADRGAPVLIVRAGDYFGAVGNGWLSPQGLLQGKPLRAVSYPGSPDLAHAWAYLPDVAETMVRLAEAGGLGDFERFHMAGHELTGRAFFEALEAAVGRRLKLGRLPWLALAALSPVNETFRELLEMRYLWDEPVLLDNRRLTAKLGAEPRTELVFALRAALRSMGFTSAETVQAQPLTASHQRTMRSGGPA